MPLPPLRPEGLPGWRPHRAQTNSQLHHRDKAQPGETPSHRRGAATTVSPLSQLPEPHRTAPRPAEQDPRSQLGTPDERKTRSHRDDRTRTSQERGKGPEPRIFSGGPILSSEGPTGGGGGPAPAGGLPCAPLRTPHSGPTAQPGPVHGPGGSAQSERGAGAGPGGPARVGGGPRTRCPGRSRTLHPPVAPHTPPRASP